MRRASKAGHYHLPVADTVVLDYEERRRRRGVLKAIGVAELPFGIPVEIEAEVVLD